MSSQLQISIAVNVFCLTIVGAMCGFVYYEVSALRGELAEIKESASSEIKTLKEALSKTKEGLVEDYNDLKNRIIINTIEERRSNLAFANAILDAVQASGAVIINKNLALPNNEFSAAEWAGNARMEARAISAVAYDRQEILSTLTSTKFGDSWLIEFDGEKSIKLYDWLKGIDVVKQERLNKKLQPTADASAE